MIQTIINFILGVQTCYATTALYTMPTWSDFTDAVGPISSGMFNTLLPAVEWGLAITIGVGIVMLLFQAIAHVFHF